MISYKNLLLSRDRDDLLYESNIIYVIDIILIKKL